LGSDDTDVDAYGSPDSEDSPPEVDKDPGGGGGGGGGDAGSGRDQGEGGASAASDGDGTEGEELEEGYRDGDGGGNLRENVTFSVVYEGCFYDWLAFKDVQGSTKLFHHVGHARNRSSQNFEATAPP